MYMYTSQTWEKYNALNTYVQVPTATGRTVKYKYTFSKLCLSTCTMFFFCIIQTQFQVQIPPVLYIMFSPENLGMFSILLLKKET